MILTGKQEKRVNARARQIDTLNVESEKKIFPSESSVSDKIDLLEQT